VPLVVEINGSLPESVAEDADVGVLVAVELAAVPEDEAEVVPELVEGGEVVEVEAVEHGAQVHRLLDEFSDKTRYR